MLFGDALVALEAVGASGLIAAAAMIAWRALSERFGRVRGRHAAGDLLGTELAVIAEAVRGVDWPRTATNPSYERRAIPRDVYRGLAESARLADFDPSTRDILYHLYWRASLGDYSYANRAVGEAIEEVAQFTAENAPGAGAAWGRLARFVTGRRRGGGPAGRREEWMRAGAFPPRLRRRRRRGREKAPTRVPWGRWPPGKTGRRRRGAGRRLQRVRKDAAAGLARPRIFGAAPPADRAWSSPATSAPPRGRQQGRAAVCA